MLPRSKLAWRTSSARSGERLRDGLLGQSFLEADSQVAGQNLDQEFSFQWRTLFQNLDKNRSLAEGPRAA